MLAVGAKPNLKAKIKEFRESTRCSFTRFVDTTGRLCRSTSAQKRFHVRQAWLSVYSGRLRHELRHQNACTPLTLKHNSRRIGDCIGNEGDPMPSTWSLQIYLCPGICDTRIFTLWRGLLSQFSMLLCKRARACLLYIRVTHVGAHADTPCFRCLR